MYPGKIHDSVGFMIAIAKTDARILRNKSVGCNWRILDVVGIGVIRNLVIVPAQRGYEAQLVRRVDIKDERPESSVSIFGVMHHLRNRRLSPEVAAVGIETGIVSESLGVVAKIKLVVCLIEIARA